MRKQTWNFVWVVLAAVLVLGCEGTPTGPSDGSDNTNANDNTNDQTVNVIINCPGGCGPPDDGGGGGGTENRAPRLGVLTSQTNVAGIFVSGIQINAIDPDGDALTYMATNLPRGLTINGTTGLISGTISTSSSDDSPFSVFVQVSDGQLSDSGFFPWTVTPVVP